MKKLLLAAIALNIVVMPPIIPEQNRDPDAYNSSVRHGYSEEEWEQRHDKRRDEGKTQCNDDEQVEYYKITIDKDEFAKILKKEKEQQIHQKKLIKFLFLFSFVILVVSILNLVANSTKKEDKVDKRERIWK